MRNKVQLITYADRLGGDLPGLRNVLTGRLAGLFGGVHVLPFFRPYDGADAGFDPADHREVDPRLGTWDDVAALADTGLDPVVDLIVNHVSTESPWFADVLARGDRSPYADMFLTFSSVFPGGATESELLTVYRPRPGLPFTPMRLGGRRRLVWTTFTPQQVDIDVRSPQARAYLTEVMEALARHGVALVRVDAVGYAVKTPGTSSFMTPDTFAFIADLSAQAKGLGLEVLVEVHSYYRRQVEIARQVDLVYDFALPPLVLHALHTADAEPLLAWLRTRPVNCVTVLDTHDGIGVVDVGADADDPAKPGLLTPGQIHDLVEAIHVASGGTSRLATGAAASNVDIYQVNCTFYDALGRDDDKYTLARLLQLFAPGVPQVYYVGLLAGTNDVELLRRTGVGRDVNRHHYTPGEIDEALERPVVRGLLAAIRFRNGHPAFGGTFACGPGERPRSVRMEWADVEGFARLDAVPGTAEWSVTATASDGTARTVTEAEKLSALV
ncbi:MAG TPA: sucrose phosphorylase [Kineosporiaceae bacterium]|nr:sucrose phosphorylase [Kineosporiaceae bacterium]